MSDRRERPNPRLDHGPKETTKSRSADDRPYRTPNVTDETDCACSIAVFERARGGGLDFGNRPVRKSSDGERKTPNGNRRILSKKRKTHRATANNRVLLLAGKINNKNRARRSRAPLPPTCIAKRKSSRIFFVLYIYTHDVYFTIFLNLASTIPIPTTLTSRARTVHR